MVISIQYYKWVVKYNTYCLQSHLLLHGQGSGSGLMDSSGTGEHSHWRTVQVEVEQSEVELTVDSGSYTAPLSAQLIFSQDCYYLGGGPAHISSHQLGHYFIGCLANVSINHQPYFFTADHQEESYGYEPSCCVAPRRPSWCFEHSTSLTFRTEPNWELPEFSVAFRIQVQRDGIVLYFRSHSSVIVIEMYTDSLYVIHSFSSFEVVAVTCPLPSSDSSWHTAEVFISSSFSRLHRGQLHQ